MANENKNRRKAEKRTNNKYIEIAAVKAIFSGLMFQLSTREEER